MRVAGAQAVFRQRDGSITGEATQPGPPPPGGGKGWRAGNVRVGRADAAAQRSCR